MNYGYLIDMDGVMYRDNQLIDGAQRFIKSLQEDGVPFMFLTNNSQRTRRDVLGDAGAARTALVGGRRGERGDLHEVEVIQHADPDDARGDMRPADQAEAAEAGIRADRRGDRHRDDRARDQRSLDALQRIHDSLPK